MLTKTKGETLEIQVPAELDHHSALTVRMETDEILEKQEIREIIFDFSRTEFCDSSGIGMLMGRYRVMKTLGGSVRAVRVKDRVYRILMLSGIHKIISIEQM